MSFYIKNEKKALEDQKQSYSKGDVTPSSNKFSDYEWQIDHFHFQISHVGLFFFFFVEHLNKKLYFYNSEAGQC